MHAFDLTPLIRSTVGFDRLMDAFDEALRLAQAAPNYPPYNIEKIGEDAYRITLAVAGFGAHELNVEQRENALLVSGAKARDEVAERQTTWLHRGIAQREFERAFQLADYVKVVGARLDNGLLHIDLARELPETMKPRKIPIGGPAEAKSQLAAPEKLAA